jgi:hypothetical protein
MAQPRSLKPRNYDVYTYASNSTDSQRTFSERQAYSGVVFADLDVSNYFNFWGEDRFYGRVNVDGNAMTVRNAFLKQLRHASAPNLFAVNFVADAWRDFADRVRRLNQEGILFKDGPYSTLNAVKSWRSPSVAYHEYMLEVIYPALVEQFLTPARQKNVKTFHDFLTYFGEFCQNVLSFAGPITYSGFVESVYCSPLNTGLVIEISTDLHSDDFNKEEAFLYDGNFPLIEKIATQYGFAIDKNAPWRFCADISSPVMVEYMTGVPITVEGFPTRFNNYIGVCDEPVLFDPVGPDPYGYSQIPGLRNVIRHAGAYAPYVALADTLYYTEKEISEVVFEAAYNPTWVLDMDLMKYYLLSFYNFYIESNPFVVTSRPTSEYCSPQGPRIMARLPASDDLFTVGGDAFGAKWSLATYYFLRILERQFPKTRAEKNKDLQSVMNQYNFSAGTAQERLQEATRFMQEKYIGPVPQNRMYTEDRNSTIISNSEIISSTAQY